MRVTLLVFGTRGEVQPLIALARGLNAAGHTARIVTQAEFHDFVTARGIACTPININLREAERSRKHGGQYSIFAIRKLAQRAQQMLIETGEACQDSDALILCDMGMIPGWPIMEKLGVPTLVAAFYPEDVCLSLMRETLGGRLRAWARRNIVTALSSRLILRPLLNRWRTKTLGLPPSRTIGGIEAAQTSGVPVLHAFSPHVFAKPAHWPDWFHITGYWFLEHAADWQPPADLTEFLAGGPPPVYVGFGSVSADDMQRTTEIVVTALSQIQQRGILAAGWNNLGQRPTLPDTMLAIEGAPHDWLFPQVAAAVHHGGAGTTAIALRSGTPNIIIPFVFDNPFWAQRVADLGVGPPGIPPEALTAERLAAAIDVAIHDEAMQARQAAMSQTLRKEEGVERAIELFHKYADLV
jgi:sterol 3beta-glucosyltransferase